MNEHGMEVKIASGVLIEKNDRFLLIKQKTGVAKGLWNNPGGLLENRETLLEAAQRETKEEVGLIVEIKGLIGAYQSINTKTLKFVFLAAIETTELNLQENEIEEAKWFSADEIKNLAHNEITFGAKQSVIDYKNKGILRVENIHTIEDVV